MDELARILGLDPRLSASGTTTRKASAWPRDRSSRRPCGCRRRRGAPGMRSALAHRRVRQASRAGRASALTSYGRIVWLHDWASAWVELQMDGTVLVRSGSPISAAARRPRWCRSPREPGRGPGGHRRPHRRLRADAPGRHHHRHPQLYMSGSAVYKAASELRATPWLPGGGAARGGSDAVDLADGAAVLREAPTGGWTSGSWPRPARGPIGRMVGLLHLSGAGWPGDGLRDRAGQGVRISPSARRRSTSRSTRRR